MFYKLKFKTKFWQIPQILLIYFLSAKYICFGIPKIFEMQFNTLRYIAYTPLVELSKHDHMWSFFGRSYNYNLFIALTEILIGMLIVFKRTRLIALLLLFGVSLNILIINIEFDNDFALYHTTFDFIACSILIIPYIPDLIKFFISNGGSMKHRDDSKKSKLVKYIPLTFVSVLFIGYSIFAYTLKRDYQSELEGTYIIEQIEYNGLKSELSKGKLGKHPMLFVEHNRKVALSINDTITFGDLYKRDGDWFAILNLPNTNKYANVKIKTDQLEGRLYDRSTHSPMDTIKMSFVRMDEKVNYLNKK